MPRPKQTALRILVILSMLVGLIALPAHAMATEYPYGYGPFSDDNGSIHELDIIAVWAKGITAGCDRDGHRYCPTDAVSRGQMAVFIAKAAGLSAPSGDHFVDDNGRFYEWAVNALFEAEITIGCWDGHFCPERDVSRAEMATLLAKAVGLAPRESGPFTDVAPGSMHAGSINAIYAEGITAGCFSDRFCPDQPVSRQQMATFLVEAFDIPPVDPLPACAEDVCGPYALVPDPPYTPEKWRGVVELFFRPEDVDRAIRVIDCESNGDPNAHNAAIDASGLFQHLDRAWADRASKAGFPGASIYDGVANTAAAAWLVYNGGGWKHWPVCG